MRKTYKNLRFLGGFSQVGTSSNEPACWSEGPSKNRKNPPSGGPNIDPRAAEIAHRSAFGATSVGYVARRARSSAEERHKSVPRAPQERPRASQERPRSPQERPRAPQERPKSARKGPKTPLKALWGALGNHFDASKLEKRAFRERSVAQLAREARSEGFAVDFQDFSSRARKGHESSDMRSDS